MAAISISFFVLVYPEIKNEVLREKLNEKYQNGIRNMAIYIGKKAV